MAPVILWLSVTRRASSFGSTGRLLVRQVDMGFIPDLDGMDTMELYARPEMGPGEGPMWGFKRRYWDLDGVCNLEMQQMHIDPAGALLGHLEGRLVTSCPRDRTWYTDLDGDPMPLLLASGWAEYSGREAVRGG